MNKKTTRLMMDGFIAVMLSILLSYLSLGVDHLTSSQANLPSMSLSGTLILPFVWLALRYGSPASLVFAAVTGLIKVFLFNPEYDFLHSFITQVPALLTGAAAGFFAKHTQKTLNNRRLKSTNLNIITATLISVFLYVLVNNLMVSIVISPTLSLGFTELSTWMSVMISWILGSLILIIMTRLNPRLIIPKRSHFLSRKETSSLLND